MFSRSSRPRGSARRRRMFGVALPGTVLTLCALLALWQLPAGALTVGGTPTPVTGNATWFTGLGSPYGGCGLPQANLDSQNFVALNVFNTPGDYTNYPRPLPASMADKIGMWDNGLNCGRYVQVTIGDNCTGVNDGAPNQPFCRNGSWVSDAYDGATLTMLVADSCGDANAWCRDDPYHLDLAQASLNTFVKNGTAVGDMYPGHWNNRHISWQFVPAPNYAGDIQVGFLQGAQVWWPAIAVSHLANGIHAVEYLQGGVWTQAQMDSDMGQAYIIGGTTSGANQFQIRVRDSNDALINGGRVYSFTLPASCGTNCGPAYTQVSYTTSAGSGPSTGPSTPPSSAPPSSAAPSSAPPSSPPVGGKACAATYRTVSSWQGGFQGEVTVTNSGSSATTGWKVTLTNPSGQTISQMWNATMTVSGAVVTATNVGYNGALSTGGTTTFGFLANNPGTPSPPTLSCTAT
ncbi:MAG TPA: cellulose binding domain-containing protein [Rugosimonospora sp.]|nr:cellulose binding domain-containing protein [Rugosimonospora sp.]